MHHSITTITLRYIGKKPFAYRAQDYKTYTLYPQDTLTLPKNHFSAYLLGKKTLFELAESLESQPEIPEDAPDEAENPEDTPEIPEKDEENSAQAQNDSNNAKE